MARQAQTPVQHQRFSRADSAVTMTSGRAGKVYPLAYIPLLRGDSASGRVAFDFELAEMPRPLLNGVAVNVQAWCVPKSAFPQFAGADEFMNSYQGEVIRALGQPDRNPPPFFQTVSDPALVTTVKQSEFFKTLGIHVPAGEVINTDLLDAFVLVYNFRLAAHSSRLGLKPFAGENLAAALQLPRAFWPSGRFSRVVPDYERALIVGALDLDVSAGQLPISGISRIGGNRAKVDSHVVADASSVKLGDFSTLPGYGVKFDLAAAGSNIFAEMANASIGVTLADIDKARTTQAFAKLRTAYAGNKTTPYANDDAIVATLMQGLRVPDDAFRRPFLLDSARVPVGFAERFATDGANLDASVTQGRASGSLSLNVPALDSGGVIIVTAEMLPERLDERQTDEWLHVADVSELPDALRDIQNPEPVDLVVARRLDAAHSTPDALYGYEPLNDKWNRAFTRLGGSFFQPDPANPWTEQRSAIWQTSIVDPAFSADHFLAPADFPHDVFSDTTAPAFEVVVRHSVAISGLTVIGDVLTENNDDYDAISGDDEVTP